MKTDELIDLLAEDTAPRWRFGPIFRIAVLCGILVAGAIFFIGIGFRPDIAQAITSVRFLFKFVLTITLAVTASAAVSRLARPGEPLDGRGWLLVAAPVLLLCAAVAELIAVPQGDWTTRLVGENARFCLTLIPLMSIGPLACLLLALRRGAPAHPGLAGAVAGLAASGIAATFYAANCTDDSPLFVATWYPIAIGFVVLVGYVAGSKLLKW